MIYKNYNRVSQLNLNITRSSHQNGTKKSAVVLECSVLCWRVVNVTHFKGWLKPQDITKPINKLHLFVFFSFIFISLLIVSVFNFILFFHKFYLSIHSIPPWHQVAQKLSLIWANTANITIAISLISFLSTAMVANRYNYYILFLFLLYCLYILLLIIEFIISLFTL